MDRQTDRQLTVSMYHANSESYFVVVQSAKNNHMTYQQRVQLVSLKRRRL